jgi:hypothetical protein
METLDSLQHADAEINTIAEHTTEHTTERGKRAVVEAEIIVLRRVVLVITILM